MLAAGVASALQSARHLYEADIHRQQAESLVEFAQKVGSSLQLNDITHALMQHASKLAGAKSSCLFLLRKGKLECVSETGSESGHQKQLYPPLGMEAVQIVQAQKSHLFHIEREFVTGHRKSPAENGKTLAIRLQGGDGEPIGLLCLFDTGERLSPLIEMTLMAMAGQASVALENSRLFMRITQSSRQWAEIFDALTDALIVHDEHNRIIRVNRLLAESIGQQPNELIGQSMHDLFPAEQGSKPTPCIFCVKGHGKQSPRLTRLKDRTLMVSSSRIQSTFQEGGKQIIHVLKDITEIQEAERRYLELFHSIQEGAYFSSPEGHFIDVNEGLVRMLGYETREELLAIDIIGQLYRNPEQRSAFREWVDSGQMFNKEVVLRRKNGEPLHARESAVAVKDEHGKIIQYRGLLQDITETKRFQAQLQRERDFNTQILNNTQSMILVVDTAGLVSYANRRCYEAGQFRHDALVGERITTLIVPGSLEQWNSAFDTALQGKPADNIDLQMLRGNGSLGQFNVSLSPMMSDVNNVTSLVAVMTDITELASMQAQLMNTEKMAAVGQLVSGVAHEVNNPLTSIMGFADLMLENPELPESVHKDLRVIIQEAQRTKQIVQNLLSFARQKPRQRRPFNANDVLSSTLLLRTYEFASHRVEVKTDFDVNIPTINGDAQQLQQVFLNILNNANDAIRETGKPGLIEVRTHIVEGGVEISFRDNGPGITAPDRILDPFYTTKEVGKGTGLGLSICYGIIHEHDGELIFGNNLDMPGACFRVWLPAVPQKSEGEEKTEHAQVRSTQ